MTDTIAPAAEASLAPTKAPTMAGLDYLLYGLVIFAWSTSWFALHLQLGSVAPEVSLAVRFGLAAVLMFLWAGLAGMPLRFPPKAHARFFLLGILLFGANFDLFYWGGITTPSGLLAVVFSCAALFNLALEAVVFRRTPELRVALGAALGFAGVLLMFSPRIFGAHFDQSALAGLGLCVAGTLVFCCGNMVSLSLQRAGIGIVPASAWGMGYGAAMMALLAAFRGESLAIEPSLAYIGSLLWLSIVSSLMGFAAYLTLLGRIGAGRAGYATVIFPVFALVISTIFEGYIWTPAALLGLALALAGNVIVLRRG